MPASKTTASVKRQLLEHFGSRGWFMGIGSSGDELILLVRYGDREEALTELRRLGVAGGVRVRSMRSVEKQSPASLPTSARRPAGEIAGLLRALNERRGA